MHITRICKLHKWSYILSNNFKRWYSHDIRNIGILAHIDAGKTTTTERMLFYAGKTRSLGEVHCGNTVTDYLAQERERGITICSSAVTFQWNDKRINLLDTPGHIDFTMEVEQSLNAVDGVVVVLDGTSGVEAQTITVWTQAEKHTLPKLVFVNKMDRPDADFYSSVEDLNKKLEVSTVCVQIPEKDATGHLSILDVISLQRIKWDPKSLGRAYNKQLLNSADSSYVKLLEKRHELIDKLSGEDDDLADYVISKESLDNVPEEIIMSALRRATCRRRVVPVFLGSAYKNVGVQSLMDGIISYLPSPDERNKLYECFENDFVGKVFKVVHDKQRGPLTLIRIFRGELKRGMRLISSIRGGSPEIVNKIYEPLADEYREIASAKAGDVAICAGLKHTVTGDLLTVSASALKHAQKRLEKMLSKTERIESIEKDHSDSDDSDLIREIFSTEPQVPDAVYFCSIEPPSLASQNAMEVALQQLQREDPSIRVRHDPVTGQTVLGGMGELHMEVIKSRILTEYKIDAEIGPLQIAYKETIDEPALETFKTEKEIAGNKQSVSITLELVLNQSEAFSLDKSPENSPLLSALRPRTIQIIKKGALAALERGPRIGGQVIDTKIKLHNVTIGRGTADSFVMAAAAQCVQKILQNCGTRLLEPVMSLQIISPAEYVASIIADLARRRSLVKDVFPKGERNKVIHANAPLAELAGYSSILRTISSGSASMTMQPCGFANMNPADENKAIRQTQGLE